jgi:hypothetical protein
MICKFCDQEFKPKWKSVIYCSKKCQLKYKKIFMAGYRKGRDNRLKIYNKYNKED